MGSVVGEGEAPALGAAKGHESGVTANVAFNTGYRITGCSPSVYLDSPYYHPHVTGVSQRLDAVMSLMRVTEMRKGEGRRRKLCVNNSHQFMLSALTISAFPPSISSFSSSHIGTVLICHSTDISKTFSD